MGLRVPVSLLLAVLLGISSSCRKRTDRPSERRKATAQDQALVPPSVPTGPATLTPQFSALFARHAHSVVNIVSVRAATARLHRYYPHPLLPEKVKRSLGSGFVIDRSGHVLTGYEVVDGNADVAVRLHDDRVVRARIVGQDRHSHLALLKIPASADLRPVLWGDSTQLQVGQWVFAIGNPFGLSHTMSQGIVSALNRTTPSRGQLGGYRDFIQTDAALNPGNDGGPLFNLNGQVVGVVVSRNVKGVGISFATPSNLARLVIGQLRLKGRVERSWMGVVIAATPRGVAIARVYRESPADKSGIRQGDLVLKWNGAPVRSVQMLRWLAGNSGVGQRVTLELNRLGKQVSATVVLQRYPHRVP